MSSKIFCVLIKKKKTQNILFIEQNCFISVIIVYPFFKNLMHSVEIMS